MRVYRCAGALLPRYQYRPERGGGAAVLTASALDFGEQLEGMPFTWAVPITNASAQPQLVHFDASCGCTTVDPRILKIGAGDTRPIRLTIDLREGAGKRVDGQPYEVTLRARLNDSIAAPQSWSIRGRVRKVLSVRPNTCEFRDELVQGQTANEVSLVLTPQSPVRDIEVRAPVGWRTRLRHDGRVYGLTVQPPPTLPPGPFEESILLRPTDPKGTALGTISVRARGRVLPVVGFLPDPVRIGGLASGARYAGTVTVGSRSGQRVRVIRAVGGPDIEVLSVSGADIRYACSADRTGDVGTFLEAVVRVSDGREQTIRGEVWYYGFY